MQKKLSGVNPALHDIDAVAPSKGSCPIKK
jgi:hypothetical protein